MTTPVDTDECTRRWAASGAMALTGAPDRPVGPPSGLIPWLDAIGRRFSALDVPALLGERAAISGLTRHGDRSCGGGCRILRALDGWIAVSLPRADDIELIPAWLGVEIQGLDAWEVVEREVAHRPTEMLLERAVLLQLAVSGLAESGSRKHVVETELGSAPPRSSSRGILVVDLSSLWAGPLCGQLVAAQGASVVKVESTRRPDGARQGPREFFDLLNCDKRCVAIDFTDRVGRAVLHALVRRADVVIESSRPRALGQLGIDAVDMVASGGPQVWVSITGYGRGGDGSNRVAFGDDAAVAGGLVVWDDAHPMFCGDAIADPLSGIAAAAACLDALEQGRRSVLDVSMAATAAACAGSTLAVPSGIDVAAPRARRATAAGHGLGEDTDAVFAELGIRP